MFMFDFNCQVMHLFYKNSAVMFTLLVPVGFMSDNNTQSAELYMMRSESFTRSEVTSLYVYRIVVLDMTRPSTEDKSHLM